MIVTALMKATLLRKPLRPYEWVGIAISTIATVLVALISIMPGHSEQQPGPKRDARSVKQDVALGSCVTLSNTVVLVLLFARFSELAYFLRY